MTAILPPQAPRILVDVVPKLLRTARAAGLRRYLDQLRKMVERPGQFDRNGARPLERIARRKRGLTVALVAVLTGFGATAFGIAPLAPDAGSLPKRLVTEIPKPQGIEAQLEALAEHPLRLHRSELTRSSDTADSLLRRLGVDDASAAAFLRSDPMARRLLEGRPGKMVQVNVDTAGRLEELIARYPANRPEQFDTAFSRLRMTQKDGSWQANVEVVPLSVQVRMGSGTIRSSLYAATDEAHVPDAIASQIAEIFGTDIDFHRELRRGDTFSAVYEALAADGEPITWNQATGRVLAAEFVNQGRTHSAVWFKDLLGRGNYFNLDGKSLRRTFLASPMEFSRVTSGFAMRLHPIAKTWRQHLGVDYAAPTGTPVRAVGEGKVEFAGWQNGYGNVVQLDHGNGHATTYAHLNRIEVEDGQRVEQGQRIGTVGATGWATGPHLHFEFRINERHKDPLVVAKSSPAATISPADREAFARLARSGRAQLEAARTVAETGLAE